MTPSVANVVPGGYLVGVRWGWCSVSTYPSTVADGADTVKSIPARSERGNPRESDRVGWR